MAKASTIFSLLMTAMIQSNACADRHACERTERQDFPHETPRARIELDR